MNPSFRVTALAVTFGVLGGVVWAQTDWRRSDALGSDLGPVAAGTSRGWVLRVETQAGTQERALFQDGKADSVRMVDTGPDGRVVRLRELRAGALVWSVSYDPSTGVPTEETAYEDDKVSEVSTLELVRGQLVRRTVKDATGTLLYTDTLSHWPDGTLRRLERDGPDGPLAEAAWTYGPSGALVRTWASEGDERSAGEHRERTFGSDRTEEDLVKGSEVVESRVTDWLEAGTSRETRTTVASGKTEVLTKDGHGRVTLDVVSMGDKVLQTKKWTYDSQGRVLEAITEAAGPREVWTYEYQTDGTVLGKLSRGEVPVREETTRDGEKIEVRYFDKGQVFLVETWLAGKRTKETYYQKGVVVRERTP
jgi:hypothetical protein